MRPLRAVLAVAAAVLGLATVGGPAAASNDPGSADQWALDRIGAEVAWEVGRGEGQVIAVVDSGVDLAHEDLRDRLVPGWDFVDDDSEPQDEYGHGTHVAGIAAATAGNGLGVAGVAPAARIMPVRVLDETGRGTLGDVVDGMKWAVDHGATVVNLSVGGTAQAVLGPGFDDAVREAWDRGAIPVVAAGNDFVLSSGFADEPALVVAATTPGDAKPDYSNGVGEARWGLSAPGGTGRLVSTPDRRLDEDVLSTWFDPTGDPDQYATLAGTSMAAPHVAGAAAILRGAGLSPQQVVDRLLSTAADLVPAGPDATFGAGRLDAARAVAGAPTSAAAGDSGGGEAAETPAVSAAGVPGAATPVPGGGAAAPSTSAGGGPQGTAAPSTTGATPTPGDAPPGSTAAPVTSGEGESATGTLPAVPAIPGAEPDDGASDDAGVPLGWAVLGAALAVAVLGASVRILRPNGLNDPHRTSR